MRTEIDRIFNRTEHRLINIQWISGAKRCIHLMDKEICETTRYWAEKSSTEKNEEYYLSENFID